MSQQVSPHTSPYLEARILNLEEEHGELRHDFNTLKDLYHNLSFSIDQLEKDARRNDMTPFQEINPKSSHQHTIESRMKPDEPTREAQEPVDGVTDEQKGNDTSTTKKVTSIPPHLRAANFKVSGAVPKFAPPHTLSANKGNGGHSNGTQTRSTLDPSKNALVTDGHVDKSHDSSVGVTPEVLPTTPMTVIYGDVPAVEALSLDEKWKPYYPTTLPALSPKICSNIPASGEMVTFHADFIHNTFEGLAWSPGLRFIQGQGPCILKNRTYYILDPKTEPFLPKSPGEHGAKLTAFFNKAPEEEFGELEHGNSYEDVPMFVKTGNRYTYFGNYSQTRWSDKLDHDTMTARVPRTVREYWAAELTTASRDEWVTEELKKHFFPKPEYKGRLFATRDDETTVTSEEEVKLNEKMTKDTKKYVESMREWKREADMRVSLIKKDFILEAFDRADADEPPALRLWWEYLECVDWRKDFYDLLVTLQSRNPAQSGK